MQSQLTEALRTIRKPQKQKRNHIGPQEYSDVCRAAFKSTNHGYIFYDDKRDSVVFSSFKRRKFTASTDLGLHTHGENI